MSVPFVDGFRLLCLVGRSEESSVFSTSTRRIVFSSTSGLHDKTDFYTFVWVTWKPPSYIEVHLSVIERFTREVSRPKGLSGPCSVLEPPLQETKRYVRNQRLPRLVETPRPGFWKPGTHPSRTFCYRASTRLEGTGSATESNL